MIKIGAHVSIAGGVENAPENANKIKARAFAMFTKNQRRWTAKPISDKSIKNFNDKILKYKFDKDFILPHDSYLINLGHPEKEKQEKSYNAFLDEMKRVEILGLKMLNIHPGSHLRQISEHNCIENIAQNINKVIENTEYATIVLENTAGQGSNIGYKFEHIRDIIDLIKVKERVGVCLDTCHMFAAGYDIRTKDSYEDTMNEFNSIIGFEKLRGMHINDAKSEFNSKKDRHHSLGEGNIGLNGFKYIINDDRIDNIPLILETIDKEKWVKEIEMLYSMKQ